MAGAYPDPRSRWSGLPPLEPSHDPRFLVNYDVPGAVQAATTQGSRMGPVENFTPADWERGMAGRPIAGAYQGPDPTDPRYPQITPTHRDVEGDIGRFASGFKRGMAPAGVEVGRDEYAAAPTDYLGRAESFTGRTLGKMANPQNIEAGAVLAKPLGYVAEGVAQGARNIWQDALRPPEGSLARRGIDAVKGGAEAVGRHIKDAYEVARNKIQPGWLPPAEREFEERLGAMSGPEVDEFMAPQTGAIRDAGRQAATGRVPTPQLVGRVTRASPDDFIEHEVFDAKTGKQIIPKSAGGKFPSREAEFRAFERPAEAAAPTKGQVLTPTRKIPTMKEAMALAKGNPAKAQALIDDAEFLAAEGPHVWSSSSGQGLPPAAPAPVANKVKQR